MTTVELLTEFDTGKDGISIDDFPVKLEKMLETEKRREGGTHHRRDPGHQDVQHHLRVTRTSCPAFSQDDHHHDEQQQVSKGESHHTVDCHISSTVSTEEQKIMKKKIT